MAYGVMIMTDGIDTVPAIYSLLMKRRMHAIAIITGVFVLFLRGERAIQKNSGLLQFTV